MPLFEFSGDHPIRPLDLEAIKTAIESDDVTKSLLPKITTRILRSDADCRKLQTGERYNSVVKIESDNPDFLNRIKPVLLATGLVQRVMIRQVKKP